MKNILLLGATGSIGDSALDVIAQNSDSLNLYGMAFHSNIDKASDIANKLFPAFTYLENISHKKMLIEKVPLQRFGHPKDISDIVLFLSSERASFITGSNFVIDGGQTVGF